MRKIRKNQTKKLEHLIQDQTQNQRREPLKNIILYSNEYRSKKG